MVEPDDQEFLRSIFLMEAWDTLATIEDGIGHLAAGDEPAWDDLFVVSHRLKGAASLHGYRQAAALADAVERALQPLRQATPLVRRAASAELMSLLKKLVTRSRNSPRIVRGIAISWAMLGTRELALIAAARSSCDFTAQESNLSMGTSIRAGIDPLARLNVSWNAGDMISLASTFCPSSRSAPETLKKVKLSEFRM